MPSTEKPFEPIFYVYIYLNPLKPKNFEFTVDNDTYVFDYEPFYVGEGHGNRLFSHLAEAKNTNISNHKLNTIRCILRKDCVPVIFKLKDSMTNKEALEYEKEVIKLIGRRNKGNGPLTNLTECKKGIKSPRKNKTYNDIYGINKALDIKSKIGIKSKNKVSTWLGKHLPNTMKNNLSIMWKGSKHMNKEGKNVYVKKDDITYYLEQGYSFGMFKEGGLKKDIKGKTKKEVWGNPEKRKEQSLRLSQPETVAKTKKSLEKFKNDNPDFYKEKGIKLAQKHKDNPELLEEKRKREKEYYAQQRLIREECYKIIKDFNLDIKPIYHAFGIDKWLKFREELTLIIEKLEKVS